MPRPYFSNPARRRYLTQQTAAFTFISSPTAFAMHASDPPGAHPAPFPLDARCDAALRDCMSTDEARRLAALRSLKILNTLPEAAYDRIVRRVNECLGVPVCVISLAEQDEMWFKAKVGTAGHRRTAHPLLRGCAARPRKRPSGRRAVHDGLRAAYARRTAARCAEGLRGDGRR
jgi:hypothetical protein